MNNKPLVVNLSKNNSDRLNEFISKSQTGSTRQSDIINKIISFFFDFYDIYESAQFVTDDLCLRRIKDTYENEFLRQNAEGSDKTSSDQTTGFELDLDELPELDNPADSNSLNCFDIDLEDVVTDENVPSVTCQTSSGSNSRESEPDFYQGMNDDEFISYHMKKFRDFLIENKDMIIKNGFWYDDAQEIYGHTYDPDPDDITIYTGFKEVMYKSIKSQISQDTLDKKEYAANYYFLGRLSHIFGDYKSSLEYFNKAIKLNPRFGLAFLGKADLKRGCDNSHIFIGEKTNWELDLAKAKKLGMVIKAED